MASKGKNPSFTELTPFCLSGGFSQNPGADGGQIFGSGEIHPGAAHQDDHLILPEKEVGAAIAGITLVKAQAGGVLPGEPGSVTGLGLPGPPVKGPPGQTLGVERQDI